MSVSQKTQNREAIGTLVLKAFAILFGFGLITVGILWEKIQLSMLPKALLKCSETKKIFGQDTDLQVIILVIGSVFALLGFAESFSVIARAIRNGKSTRKG